MSSNKFVRPAAIAIACGSVVALFRYLRWRREAYHAALKESRASADASIITEAAPTQFSDLPHELQLEVLKKIVIAARDDTVSFLLQIGTCKAFHAYFRDVAINRCEQNVPGFREVLRATGVTDSPFAAYGLAKDVGLELARRTLGLSELVPPPYLSPAPQSMTSQSRNLICSLARTFFSQLVHLRGCFPENCFEKQTVGKGYGSGLTFMVLKNRVESASSPTAHYMRSVEAALHALNDGYLQTATLVISADPEGHQPLEKHSLSLICHSQQASELYGPAGATPLPILLFRIGNWDGRSWNAPLKEWMLLAVKERYTMSYFRDTAVQLLRLLVQNDFLRTTPPLPPKHFLHMHLEYKAGTPTDYAPPGGGARLWRRL